MFYIIGHSGRPVLGVVTYFNDHVSFGLRYGQGLMNFLCGSIYYFFDH